VSAGNFISRKTLENIEFKQNMSKEENLRATKKEEEPAKCQVTKENARHFYNILYLILLPSF